MLRGAGLAALFSMLALGSAQACRVAIPFDELARSADVIVVGRLRDVRQVEGPALMPDVRYRHYEATIEVERTLWPEGATASTRTLRWKGAPAARLVNGQMHVYSVSTDLHHERLEGERVLWLLDEPAGPAGNESYVAGHGSRIALDDDSSVRAARLPLIAMLGTSCLVPHPARPAPWKSDVRLERLKNLFDETLADLEASRRTSH